MLVQVIVVSFYLSGNGGITGAGFPPNPVVTSAAVAPNPVLLPKPAVGALPNPAAAGAPNVVGVVDWIAAGGV
jgi:hypothetical protein